MLLLPPLLLLTAAAPSAVEGFFQPTAPIAQPRHSRTVASAASSSASSSSSASGAPKQATLDSRTPWQLSLTLTRQGFDPVRGHLQLRFVQTPNYEPPQGRIFVERDSLALVATDDKGFGACFRFFKDRQQGDYPLINPSMPISTHVFEYQRWDPARHGR